MSRQKPESHENAAEHAEEAELPEVEGAIAPMDFVSLIKGFTHSALVALGEQPDEDGRRTRDLALARHNIELLAMLRDKTRGNLSGAEEQVVEELLSDLRRRFIAAVGQSKKR